MRKRVAQFASEAELCARFIAVATGQINEYGNEWRGAPRPTGWTAYPETAGWDILMVRATDGFQVGLQAKLRLNDDVILQTIEQASSWQACAPGPDCRAVLVPHGTGSELHRFICATAGIQIVTVHDGAQLSDHGITYRPQVEPSLPHRDTDFGREAWPQMLPTQRETLPIVVPDVPAGVKSPLQLTAWKVKAIKIAIVLEKRGWLCRQDFKHVQIDHRRFLDSGWLAVIDGAWRAGPAWPDFKLQHPRNYDEIAALYDDWKPAEPGENFGRLV